MLPRSDKVRAVFTVQSFAFDVISKFYVLCLWQQTLLSTTPSFPWVLSCKSASVDCNFMQLKMTTSSSNSKSPWMFCTFLCSPCKTMLIWLSCLLTGAGIKYQTSCFPSFHFLLLAIRRTLYQYWLRLSSVQLCICQNKLSWPCTAIVEQLVLLVCSALHLDLYAGWWSCKLTDKVLLAFDWDHKLCERKCRLRACTPMPFLINAWVFLRLIFYVHKKKKHTGLFINFEHHFYHVILERFRAGQITNKIRLRIRTEKMARINP